jgi:lysophospholipase L1-like esterase
MAMWRSAVWVAAAAVSLGAVCGPVQGQEAARKFTCSAAGRGVGKGTEALTAATLYKDGAGGFGFDLSMPAQSFAGGACGGSKPFFFSIAEPEGNYQVTLVLGGPEASTETVRAESRRLFVDQMQVPAGGSRRVVFNVNVRTKEITPEAGATAADAARKEVRLKPREIGALDWDDKLTLEFNGANPSVRAIEVRPVDVPTIYIAGDSTVVDQDKEPWTAWGQILPVFVGPKVAIANDAESGETIRSFVEENRLAKVMSTMRRGDYLMIQFAHNDQKPGRGYVPAQTQYKDLLRSYIAQTRAHGATPILVTSMNRRDFDASGHIVQTLGDYPAAMREVAVEQKVALIPLNAMSKTLFEAMGEQGTLHAFVHFPANTFPDQPQELKDNTHFTAYGAYELTRAIVQSVRDQKLPIAKYLRPGIPRFDPAHPLPFVDFHLPASPWVSMTTPYER